MARLMFGMSDGSSEEVEECLDEAITFFDLILSDPQFLTPPQSPHSLPSLSANHLRTAESITKESQSITSLESNCSFSMIKFEVFIEAKGFVI